MSKNATLKILITNDDGVGSEAMLFLANALTSVSNEKFSSVAVFVMAPREEQSGMAHAFSLRALSCEKISNEPYVVFSLDGTPADCVKFAISEKICGGEIPDLVFSGINFGENSGVSSLYSGTVAGAREAALWGIPAVSLSLRSRTGAHLKEAVQFAKRVVSEGMFLSMPKGVFWNVNFPDDSVPYQGVLPAEMATNMFTDHYEKRGEQFFLEGEKLFNSSPKHTDDFLLSIGFAALTPHRIDQTDLAEVARLRQLELNPIYNNQE